uniref:DDT domain-containing protein PTM n=1 Tax=Davidia involucrata TaxID=16924 RepID=A0A5B6ZI79_DAVIN
MEFLGRTVRKEFKGFGVFSGIVKSYDPSTGFYEIVYEDGDCEELELSEIASLLEGMVVDQSGTGELTKKPRVGRKPKKRRRVEICGDSGNNSANLMNYTRSKESSEEIQTKDGASQKEVSETLAKVCAFGENLKGTVSVNGNLNTSSSHDGINLNDGFNLNDGWNTNDGYNSNGNYKENTKRSTGIDLNLDVNGDYIENSKGGDSGVPIMESHKRKHLFDLNLGLDDEIKITDADCNGQMMDNTSFQLLEETQKEEIGEGVEETQMEGGSANEALKGVCFEVSEGTPIKAVSDSAANVLGDSCVRSVDGIPGENCISSGGFRESGSLGVADAKCMSSEVQLREGLSDAGTPLDHGYQGDSGSTYKGRNRRKRRKLSDNVNSATDTVLRRSTRRGIAIFSAQNLVSSATLSLANDAYSSPAVSAVSEEKPTLSGCEESEERSVLPPKLQLPPSSENLNLDDIPILDLFSVYACLRSFSTLLFLSPFELEDFVAALKCKAPNLLFDFIHVSLLQTLKKHLEFLSGENSQSASNCLRSLNWDLLDLITWPIFMVEYLLMHSSGLKPGFDLCRLKLFEIDYYKQPAFVKIEILRCLCDDVIEVEAIRSELNRRTFTSDLNMDSDRNMKIETSKKRRAQMDVSGGSCLTEEVVDETTDWNSDECCLCKMDGSLICCDGCPAAYHSRCVGVANSLLPEGDWFCPECVIDKDKPWMKLGKSLRGAELLGIDPHGRLYYSSCGYLLVSDSCDTESSVSYYHKNDLAVVIEALKLSDIHYSTILSVISKQWDILVTFNGAKSDLNSQILTSCSDFMKGQVLATMPPLLLAPSDTCVKDEIVDERKPEEVSELVNVGPVTVNHFIKMENLKSSEGSAEIPQATIGIQNSQKTGPDCLKRSAGISNDSEIPGKIGSVNDCSLMSTILDVEQGRNIHSVDHGHKSSPIKTKKRDASQGQCGTGYMNYYSFAQTASLVAEELTRKSSDKVMKDSTWSVEEIILAQLKAISKKSTKFCWPNIQNLNADARREKCGWCFSCRVPDDDRDCLFYMNDAGPAPVGFTSEMAGLRSKRNRKGHLIDVMCHVLCIEDRLHGLLLGPWLNPHYTKLLRKSVLKASDVASVKHLLLMLESNLRQLALSPEWLKHMDSVARMGSASHVVTNSLRVSSKHAISKKRTRFSDLEPNPSSNAAAGLGLFWWRGGRLSRQLFNWKVLPHSLASKAARQAGCTKIPGILYPDSSEFAKISKYVAWRAAVETSRSVEQLALQVRELDVNIRWDEIENTNLLSMMDKESKKSIRSFKKVIIRRKCLEGTVMKYLLDFGKRRFIPDVVVRHGSMLEESSSGRKKYWLEESHVPLHLLKVFEEKRIARKSNKMSSGKLRESGREMKKASKIRGFSYLFSKAERSENYQCGHCNKDVLIREAVSCQYCEGFFHKRHVRKSVGAITAECTYTCHKCQDGKSTRIDTKKGKPQLPKSNKVAKVCRSLRSNTSKNSCNDKQPVQLQNIKKDSVAVPLRRLRKDSVAVPLRRSARKVKCVSLQNKKVGGRKKGKQIKSRKGKSKKPKKGSLQKKRTQMCHTYWLNGLLLTRKPNDERVMHFRSKRLLAPSEQSSAILDQPKCSLCCEPEFTSMLNYIGCEICGDWFHGDAFGLSVGNVGNLIGFRCHKCCNRTPPICPHVYGMRSNGAQLDELKNNVGIKCAKEVSDVTLPNEVLVMQKSHSDDESKKLILIDESSQKEQQSGTVPNSNQTPMLDAENGHLPISTEHKTEAFENSNDKGWKPDALLGFNENILSEENTIEVGGGHTVIVTTLVETESPLSKSDVDVIDQELASLGHDNSKNDLVKTTDIVGSLVNRTLIDSSELPPQEILASGELLDGGEKMV